MIKKKDCLDKQCQHGKCIKYANDPTNQTFCQCDQGWSGEYCTIQHQCQCSFRFFMSWKIIK